MGNMHVAQRIVVPLDGSHVVRAALEPAAAIAAACGGELVLAIVVNAPFVRAVEDFVRLEHTTPEQAAEMYLHQVESDLPDGLDEVSIRQETRLSEVPADAVLELAHELDATMIAMTSHGHSGFKKLILGSVTQEVLNRSEIPVLVVPIGEFPDSA